MACWMKAFSSVCSVQFGVFGSVRDLRQGVQTPKDRGQLTRLFKVTPLLETEHLIFPATSGLHSTKEPQIDTT